LASDFDIADGTVIASVIEVGEVKTSWDNWDETGVVQYPTESFDTTNYPPVLNNLGTIEQEWTITIGAADTFTVEGDTVGSIDPGQLSLEYSHINPDTGTPYFVLPVTAWQSGLAEGDVITFETHPSAVPRWTKRVTPSGSDGNSVDGYKVILGGQTGGTPATTSSTTTTVT